MLNKYQQKLIDDYLSFPLSDIDDLENPLDRLDGTMQLFHA